MPTSIDDSLGGVEIGDLQDEHYGKKYPESYGHDFNPIKTARMIIEIMFMCVPMHS